MRGLVAMLVLVTSGILMPLDAQARGKGHEKDRDRDREKVFIKAHPRKAPEVKVVSRRMVVVHEDFPIHRRWEPVYVRRPHVVVRVGPRLFLPPLMWPRVVVPLPQRDQLVWQDTDRLDPADGWAETVFDVNRAGRTISLEVRGVVDGDFAEIVFKDGETQVVDFETHRMDEGNFTLVDLPGGVRHVDHVRVVARAVSERPSITMRLLR